ncbi:DUF2567 domain-containing protein [Nocardia mexicana]|uniref:Uncharacterized protein DUF2567 n=1 Tax=Nocardia mexicana TaxID=279262 RepID=A0A370H2B6_9NOCA|nr:DUF2567 domain-containing protein [Nocardia mexicana]RDI49758.1 uncharacterized protein DUF2567 [Nocardia mexicana]
MAHQSAVVPSDARRRELRAVLWVVAAVLLVSAVGGALWGVLAPAEKVLVVEPGRGAALPGESAHRFDAVAIFVCAGAIAGLLSAAAVWRLRRLRGPLLQGGLLAGSLAGAWLMSWVGDQVAGLLHPRPSNPPVQAIVELAPAIVPSQVTGWTQLMVQPLIASLVVLVLAALSTSEDLGSGAGSTGESPDGARPYASDVTYGPYGTPVSQAIHLGPFQGADSGSPR